MPRSLVFLLPGEILYLIMLAAPSFLINIRAGGVAVHESEPDAASHTPAACLAKGGCFHRGGTSLAPLPPFVGGNLAVLSGFPCGQLIRLSSDFLSWWCQDHSVFDHFLYAFSPHIFPSFFTCPFNGLVSVGTRPLPCSLMYHGHVCFQLPCLSL